MVLACNTNSGIYKVLTLMLVSVLGSYILWFDEYFPIFARTIMPPTSGSTIYPAVTVFRAKIYIYI